jgi:hypothetical protein
LRFFSPGAPAVFLSVGYAGYVTPCRVLIVVPIISFLSSLRGLEFPLFDWSSEALLQSQWGMLGFCALEEAGLLAPLDCYSVEELGGVEEYEALGFCVLGGRGLLGLPIE